MKQVALITLNEKIVYAVEVREIDSFQYLKLKDEAKENIKDYFKKFELMNDEIKSLKEEIETLKHEIRFLKGEE